MGNKNDDKILELKKQIEAKKSLLNERSKRPTFYTNLVLEIDEKRINLNVADRDQLIMLLVKLNMYRMSYKDLGCESPTFCGYPIEEWMEDIHAKLTVMDIKKDESNLKVLEDKLNKMLSEEKKTELELESIEDMLK